MSDCDERERVSDHEERMIAVQAHNAPSPPPPTSLRTCRQVRSRLPQSKRRLLRSLAIPRSILTPNETTQTISTQTMLPSAPSA